MQECKAAKTAVVCEEPQAIFQQCLCRQKSDSIFIQTFAAFNMLCRGVFYGLCGIFICNFRDVPDNNKIAILFRKALNKKLSARILVANKAEQQELDFEISTSGMKEVNAILHSMNKMCATIKAVLERQWQTEKKKNRQISALAHDLKIPLTIEETSRTSKTPFGIEAYK